MVDIIFRDRIRIYPKCLRYSSIAGWVSIDIWGIYPSFSSSVKEFLNFQMHIDCKFRQTRISHIKFFVFFIDGWVRVSQCLLLVCGFAGSKSRQSVINYV